jgi:hypothetical protein
MGSVYLTLNIQVLCVLEEHYVANNSQYEKMKASWSLRTRDMHTYCQSWVVAVTHVFLADHALHHFQCMLLCISVVFSARIYWLIK